MVFVGLSLFEIVVDMFEGRFGVGVRVTAIGIPGIGGLGMSMVTKCNG
jgi:hypothetical protein